MNRCLFVYCLLIAALVGAAITGCSFERIGSSSEGNAGKSSSSSAIEVIGSDETGLWAKFAASTVAGYFESVADSNGGEDPIDVATLDNDHCKSPALAVDEGTVFLDEMNAVYSEGRLVQGVCETALSLKSGQVAPLGMDLTDSIKVGTVEFWFRPGDDFYDMPARTLLGNDEARIHFFVKNGKLIFQKNHADQHIYVAGPAKLNADWNKIAGQWGDGRMSLWLNDTLIAVMNHSKGYAPSLRGRKYGNLLVIGFKTRCCMERTGQYDEMTTSGAYDQVRVSNVVRYQNYPEELPEGNEFYGADAIEALP